MRSNIFAAAAHWLFIGLWLWLAVSLLWLPLFLLGIPICAWLAWREAWHLEPSKCFPDKHNEIAVWNPRWAQLWGNDEDGVTGDWRWWPARCAALAEKGGWRAKFWGSERCCAWMWSAVRNPVNNFRFLPIVDYHFDRTRIRYVGNSDDPALDLKALRWGAIRGRRVFWFYCWHGLYPAFWLIVVRDNRTHARLRLGWKHTPDFRHGIPAGDYRNASEAFTPLQFGWRRKG